MIKKYYIMGLPSSGKTTFLAALGYALLMSNENTITLENCSDLEYINNIAGQWSSCCQTDHTHIETREEIRMTVSEAGGDGYELQLPDRAGELFKKKHRSESSMTELRSALWEDTKILFFINPTLIRPEPMIGDVSEKYRECVNTEKSGQTDERLGENTLDPSSFALGDQAEHVELLQSALESGLALIDITVVISAWDIIAKDERIKKPEDALYYRLPLLWQVIESHKDVLHINYWGISAQGGNWANPDEREQLLSKPCLNRAYAVDSDGSEVLDFTKILL